MAAVGGKIRGLRGRGGGNEQEKEKNLMDTDNSVVIARRRGGEGRWRKVKGG